MPIGRVTQVVDCREAMGMGKGGGIAQRGTISECRYPDVIVVGMSPGRRHVTKPVAISPRGCDSRASNTASVPLY